MPLPKYYCDYCDRTFNDLPAARRKHFESNHHKTSVKLHYESYRDPVEMRAEEEKRPPCKNILLTGKCDYMAFCRYRHSLPQNPANDPTKGIHGTNTALKTVPPPSMAPPPQGGYKLFPHDYVQWG